jgi:uncharacterized protein
MPSAVLYRAFEVLVGSTVDSVILAGGEPLLALDRVREAVDLSRQRRIRQVGIQTNGLGLTDEVIAYLRDNEVGIGLSVDGLPPVNDWTRGKGTRVWRVLHRLETMQVPIGITTTVTKFNVEHLPQLLLALGAIDCVRSLGLDVLRIAGRATPSMLPDPRALADSMRECLAIVRWLNRKRQSPLKLREAEHVDCGQDPGAYCAALQGLNAVVLPNGDLYPCSSLCGHDDWRCGTVDQPDWVRLTSGLTPISTGCATCGLAKRCRGRCPARALTSLDAAQLDCVLRTTVAQATTSGGS